MAFLLDAELTTRILKGVDFANSLTVELITISSGILTLTITFTKDIFKGNIQKARRLLTAAWFSLFFSIISGIWAMMGLSGSLINTTMVPKLDRSVFDSARLPAIFQILTFLLGLLLAIIYGYKGISSLKETPPPKGQP
jgi:hypothetical protein